jgi:hypothetical protein
MLDQTTLLAQMETQARDEAKRRHLDSLYAESLIDEARELVRDLFSSVWWKKAELTSWRHRSEQDREDDWRYMGFDRASLRNAAERYLDRPWLHCRELDWLILNVLTYAECQATLEFVRVRTMPLTRYLISWTEGGTTASVITNLWRLIVFVVKGGLWTAMLALSFLLTPAGALLWSVAMGWYLYQRRKARRKVA